MKPGSTTRTTYFANGRSASVSGVRPLHTPFTVTAARDGVELTTMRPVVTAASGLRVVSREATGGVSARRVAPPSGVVPGVLGGLVATRGGSAGFAVVAPRSSGL